MAQNIYPMSQSYEEYLTDESKYRGYADSISFPESSEEVADILKELSKKKVPVTIQGGKTGIVGGAIPVGGHILNLSHMNRVLDSWEEDGTGRIVVQPGINLIDLKKEINNLFRKNPRFWPADPTETSASVGGIAASGAQGISRILYGKSGQYIEAVNIMDYEGRTTKLCRGEKKKLSDDEWADALELVIGKEGITGIITELTLILLPKPECNSDPDEAWAVSEEAEVEKLHVFRHAAAETVNLFIEERHREDNRITKLGMDMMSGQSFEKALESFKKELKESGLKGCIFGHALESHLHVNILPETYEEYCKGVNLVRKWAFEIESEQGTLIGEHGIGKLKRDVLGNLIPDTYVRQCKKAKKMFDTENMINRGNIWKV